MSSSLGADQILILEGIHGLNPDLIPDVPAEKTFRAYVSCLTQLNLDRHNRISTTDTRMIRRIVRDMRERGYTAQQTIARWESVRRGEKRWIFPYQENADVMFQFGNRVRDLRDEAAGGAPAAPGPFRHAGVHRSQAAAGIPGLVPAPGRRPGPG